MRKRSFFDRMTEKTVSSLLCAHLQEHYRLSPAAATTLASDLLRHAQLMNQAGRRDGQVVYQAVALGEPTGKPLGLCRKLPVRLSLFAEGDMGRFAEEGRVAMTQAVMVRIAREAVEQGAALTVEDQAWLLRLSPATVKRYRRQIRKRGAPFPLRGDLSDAGPSTTHRDQIVKLFLLGYSETEIAERCQHRLECVEAYVGDFLRVALLAREGKAAGTICRLVKLSRTKVRAIVGLYERLGRDPDFVEPVDHWLDLYALDRRMKKRGTPK